MIFDTCVFEKNIIIRLRLSYPDNFETIERIGQQEPIYYMVHRSRIFRNLQSKPSFDSGGSSLPRVQLTWLILLGRRLLEVLRELQ